MKKINLEFRALTAINAPAETFWQGVERVSDAQRKQPEELRELSGVAKQPFNAPGEKSVTRSEVVSREQEIAELLVGGCAFELSGDVLNLVLHMPDGQELPLASIHCSRIVRAALEGEADRG